MKISKTHDMDSKLPVKFIIHVSAVFTNQQNQILLVKEGNVNKTSYGKYNLPGGHLELNEGLNNGTAREIKEETGIEVYIDFLIGIYTGYSHNHCINYIFHAEYKGGNIEPQKNEILECNWFSSEQIMHLDNNKILNPKKLKKIITDYVNGNRAELRIITENIYG